METTQNNTKAAVKFLELIAARKIDEAFETYVDMSGTHHNPFYPAGFPSLQRGMKENDAQIPEKKLIVKNVLGDGDMVAVHFHLILKPYEMAVVHLFRFKENKIVELWDCGMAIPDDSPNKDGVF
ncbi:MAG: nuclear transport factor 2 family protein [Pyrinomonadaceae bacterium]|nr:nuclear transport factor 2 family protein [Pyrinomonadaceae bacterium]